MDGIRYAGGTVLLLALVGIAAATAASAQDAPPSEIVVTGSRIPRLNDKSTSPVTTVGSEESSSRALRT